MENGEVWKNGIKGAGIFLLWLSRAFTQLISNVLYFTAKVRISENTYKNNQLHM
jgi:hypothetical protein